MSRDFLDRPIVAGCTIVYPVRRGSRMWLKKLLVTQVSSWENAEGKTVWQLAGTDNFGHRIKIRNLENCIMITP